MSILFPSPPGWPPPNTYARAGGSWYRTSTYVPVDGEVRIVVHRLDEVSEFVRSHALGQESRPPVWVVRLPADAVDETIKVVRYARYRGAQVILDGFVDGLQTVSLVSNDPRVAAELGFEGDGRIVAFRKEVAPEDLTNLRDEVRVRWRRGVGRVS